MIVSISLSLTHTHTHTHKHTCIHIYRRKQTFTKIHTLTHIYTRTHVHCTFWIIEQIKCSFIFLFYRKNELFCRFIWIYGNHGNTQTILKIVEDIRCVTYNKDFSGEPRIDLRKIFDAVNHEWIPKKLVYQIRSTMDRCSSITTFSCGAPQVWLSGLVLFLNDLPMLVISSTALSTAETVNKNSRTNERWYKTKKQRDIRRVTGWWNGKQC